MLTRVAASASRRGVRAMATAAAAADRPSLTGEKWDAVVIGGGHNGLTSAAYLAQAGKRVLVLEKRHIVGGAAVTEEMTEGFKFSRCSYLLSLLRPQIINDLALDRRHGLQWFLRDPSSYTPTPSILESPVTGRPTTGLTLWGDPRLTHESIAQYSQKDADAYGKYCSSMSAVAASFADILDQPPPELQHLSRVIPAARRAMTADKEARDRAMTALRLAGESIPALAALGGSLMRLGADIPLLWEVLTGPASRILDRWFESGPLKATLATDGVIGANVGPGTPGSAYVLLHHVMGGVGGEEGAWAYVRGGMGAVSTALESAAKEAGAVVATGVDVQGIDIDPTWRSTANVGRGGKWRWSAASCITEQDFGEPAREEGMVSGVRCRLQDGTEVTIETDSVLCGASPAALFGGLLSHSQCSQLLPAEVWSRLQSFDTAPAASKLNVALRGLPAFPQAGDDPSVAPSQRKVAPHHGCTIHFEEDMHEIATAHAEAVAEGRPSSRPIVELTMPSVLDDSLAPPGHHVANLFVQYSPYDLTHPDWAAGWKDEGVRRCFMDSIYDVVERASPGFRQLVMHEDLLTPVDLEEQIGLPKGNIFHGAMSVDQLLWMRPAPGLSRHRTPIGGLYLCGSGAHPGGGVMGAPGRNAAGLLLSDLNHDSS